MKSTIATHSGFDISSHYQAFCQNHEQSDCLMNDRPQFLEDIQIGQGSECEFTITESMIMKFADLSGDHNPIHVDEEFAKTTPYKGRIAHGMLGGAFISATLAKALPGAVYVSQSLSFKRPMRIDDRLFVKISVIEIELKTQRVLISTRVLNEKNKIIMDGEAVAMVARRPQ